MIDTLHVLGESGTNESSPTTLLLLGLRKLMEFPIPVDPASVLTYKLGQNIPFVSRRLSHLSSLLVGLGSLSP